MVSAVLEHENGHVVQDLEGLDMEKMIGIRNDPRAMPVPRVSRQSW